MAEQLQELIQRRFTRPAGQTAFAATACGMASSVGFKARTMCGGALA